MRQRPLATAPPRRRRKAPPAGRPAHPSEISAGLPTPRQQQKLSKVTLTPAQRRVARRLVRQYQGSGTKNDLRFLDRPVSELFFKKGAPKHFAQAVDVGVGHTVGIKPSSLVHDKAAGRSMAVSGGIGGLGVVRGPGGFRVPEGAADIGEFAKPAVEPHVSKTQEFRGSVPDLAHEKGYLYHRTTPERLPGIKKSGLRPAKPTGNPEGVYFGNSPLEARGLSQTYRNHVYLRVKKSNVANLEQRAFAETRTPHPVPPHHIEYLGKDSQWHPLTHEAPGDVVAKSLGAARRLAAEQKKMGRVERAERVGRGQAAMEQAGGGRAGFEAAMREQRGELPKTTFNRLREGQLGTADVEQLIRHAQEHPDLRFWEKQNVTKALLDAFEHGRTPRPHEIKLLQTAFGQDAAAALSHASFLTKAGRLAVDVTNIPRTVMASVDLSAPFRQGLVAGARHPNIFARNFGPMIKAFGSERVYEATIKDIFERPNAPLYEESGLKITTAGADLGQREEAFISSMAEKIPLVRNSSRAYHVFLDKMRADMFDRQLELAQKQGVNVEDRTQLRSIARLVNNATGRGDLGPAERWAPALNAFFFSPRLIGSRISMLNPVWYATLTPFARKQAIISMVRLGSVAAGVLGLGSYFGAKVTTDPRSADFAKLRIGNTRADVLGGFQQYLRVGAQLGSGKVISSTTGKTMTLGPGFADLSRKDILDRFVTGKFSPPASFVNDFFKGTQFDGQPFSWKKAVLQRTVPLVAQDAYDLGKDTDSVQLAMLGYSISAFGIGMQTYSNQAPAKARAKLHEATKTQNVHLANLVRKGVLPRNQAKRMRQALDIYDKRNQINTTIDAATKNKPLTRERQKLDALLSLLQEHKVLKPSEVKHWRGYVSSHPELTPKQIQKARSWFWRDSGLERAITWYRDKAGAND